MVKTIATKRPVREPAIESLNDWKFAEQLTNPTALRVFLLPLAYAFFHPFRINMECDKDDHGGKYYRDEVRQEQQCTAAGDGGAFLQIWAKGEIQFRSPLRTMAASTPPR